MIKFLVGVNDYGKSKYLKSVVSNDPLNTIVLDEPTVEELVSECVASPVMSDHRDVVILSTKKLDWEMVSGYLPKVPVDTRLYILVDKLPAGHPEFTPLATEFKEIKYENELLAYTRDAVSSVGVQFASNQAFDAFFLLAGQSELDIDNWLSYLATSFFPEHKITVDEVRRFIPRVREITPINIFDYVLKGEMEYTFYLLENFIAGGGDWSHLGYSILGRLRRMMLYSWAINRQNLLSRMVAQQLNISTFIVNILKREITKFTPEDLTEYFLQVSEAVEEATYENDPTLLRGVIRQMCMVCQQQN